MQLLDEVAGSNAFMTRDQAGRVLFNSVVLGRKLELTPPQRPQRLVQSQIAVIGVFVSDYRAVWSTRVAVVPNGVTPV